MCGIAGFVHEQDAPAARVRAAVLERMCRVIRHRGPDDQGTIVTDTAARRLFLARDRAGKKPLYYALTPRGTLVFGSELKSLLEHPEIGRAVNPEAVDAYLTFGYVPDPLCILRGVRKLPPAHHLTYAAG